jgi:hypothetical protein
MESATGMDHPVHEKSKKYKVVRRRLTLRALSRIFIGAYRASYVTRGCREATENPKVQSGRIDHECVTPIFRAAIENPKAKLVRIDLECMRGPSFN